jgi:hypothetical protein
MSITPKERALLIVDDILSSFEKSVQRVVSLYDSADEAMEFIEPEMKSIINKFTGLTVSKVEPEIPPFTGERRDLVKLLGCKHWTDVILFITECKILPEIKVGDFFKLPVIVEETEINGLEFEELNIRETEVIVIEVSNEKIIFQFDDIIFHNAVNAKNTNSGGLSKSDLGEYLNSKFLVAVFGTGIASMLTSNKDGMKITLPTLFEVFGDRDDKSMNWSDDPYQFEYFKKIKNRIKTFDNDTNWWWLANPTAARATHFCGVSGSGLASYSILGASEVSGGVAPAFCAARRHK